VTPQRPRLAPAFTIAVDAAAVWLIAGEDLRYRLGVDDDPRWLAELLSRCDGSATFADLIESIAASRRSDAEATITRLYEERVIFDGTAEHAHTPGPSSYTLAGRSALAEAMRGRAADDGVITVLAQDRLDYSELLNHNRAALAAKRRWMWITTGPGGRAYVGPLFVPDAGPCAECLLVHFKRLSPVPELYDLLLDHGAHGRRIAASPFPAEGIDVTVAIARWKLAMASESQPQPALYALHVINVADLTVSSHIPLGDPECPACRS
jgi:bacteriocin biosynthesis cyclodehydratase domain-containing protein